MQQLNMFTEPFFQAQQDCKENINTHVARIQKLFVDLNGEWTKHSANTLSERKFTGQILSPLGKEYDSFNDVWDTIPTSKQMVNLRIETLCATELRADRLALCVCCT